MSVPQRTLSDPESGFTWSRTSVPCPVFAVGVVPDNGGVPARRRVRAPLAMSTVTTGRGFVAQGDTSIASWSATLTMPLVCSTHPPA